MESLVNFYFTFNNNFLGGIASEIKYINEIIDYLKDPSSMSDEDVNLFPISFFFFNKNNLVCNNF